METERALPSLAQVCPCGILLGTTPILSQRSLAQKGGLVLPRSLRRRIRRGWLVVEYGHDGPRATPQLQGLFEDNPSHLIDGSFY
jgi:hypothetical protein